MKTLTYPVHIFWERKSIMVNMELTFLDQETKKLECALVHSWTCYNHSHTESERNELTHLLNSKLGDEVEDKALQAHHVYMTSGVTPIWDDVLSIYQTK